MTLPGQAHEVRPAVGDVTVTAEQVRVDLTVTLEALVAGIDMAGLSDTNESPLSGYYDRLRALPPQELEQAFDKVWPRIAQGLVFQVGDTRIVPDLAGLRIPEVGDTALPRDSVLVLTAVLPTGDAPVQIGWAATNGPLVLRQMGQGDDLYSGYLTGGALSDPLPREGVAQVGAITEFGRYVVLGFEHILPKGLDHILFVLGLFLFSLQMRPLLLQVTAFTLAHTVTLALASLKIVTVPAEIVEPLIAASIVFVAVENIIGGKLGWRRVAVVFAFGLLHGLGFASVLGEIGLNPARFVADLIGFNIGVEIGQLTVIALAYLAVGLWFGRKPWYRAAIVVPGSAAIALVGAWWVVERTLL
ncbi:HupE/UreJ family protein [Actibacterium sp. XHP0104]|uniref:HupE/UreJ family protein n=1 Tax=Actibacterium sp. XHP0104 TaxID=2984335 RepID=UPI0021E78DC1|nr:HupE/UreJ family protein [Actibacterium sp. XHP0104]MCV2882025.1 HupE/UreJ family protein [Actibacterium sp. XHP0104]